MKRNKFIRLAAAWLALLLLCSGCSQTAETPAAQKHRVALIAKSTETEFWKSVFAGAQTAATEYNLALDIRGPATEEDYETQNAMVAQAVEDGAEVIVFSAIDYQNNAPAIDAAYAAGVEIVAIDSGVDSRAVSTYLGTDNYAAGQQAAQAAVNSGAEQLYVGLINYDVSSANGQERERGVRDALKSQPNVTIVDTVNVLAAASAAQSGADQMLARHPQINVLIAFNEPTCVGAARAVKELHVSDSVWLVGFDSNVEAVDGLRTGTVDSLIVQNPYAMGYLGVESAYKLLSGQSGTLEATVDTETRIVDTANMFSADSQKALFAFG